MYRMHKNKRMGYIFLILYNQKFYNEISMNKIKMFFSESENNISIYLLIKISVSLKRKIYEENCGSVVLFVSFNCDNACEMQF